MTDAERTAITAALGPLPDDLMRAVRDARGHAFQRLEFLGDAVLELVVRFHAVVADGACAGCGGDPDRLVTDVALGADARAARLGAWLEWEPSAERLADLVEACAGAVWSAHGWVALAGFVDRVVHPLAPIEPLHVASGWPAPLAPHAHRGLEVLGASVLEVAAAHAAYAASDADEGLLTEQRNRLYGAFRVADRAHALGWVPSPVRRGDRHGAALARDAVERRLADLALTSGLVAAVDDATALLGPA